MRRQFFSLLDDARSALTGQTVASYRISSHCMGMALDDWTRSVTSAPQKEPRCGVAAALLSTVRSSEPANAFRPSVMTVMPRRKRPTPPSTEIAVDMCVTRGERR